MKRKFVSVEDERAYLDILQQMLSEALLARLDRSVGGGGSSWRVPDLVTGMVERGTDRKDEERAMSRNKRKEKLYSFIKKTVVPYPRLG